MSRTYEPVLQKRRTSPKVSATIRLLESGEGQSVAWAGFDSGTGAWVQAGIFCDGRVYFEFNRKRYLLRFGPQVDNLLVNISVRWKFGRWVADYSWSGGLWRQTVPLTLPLPFVFVGVERLDGGSGRFEISGVG
jgi:hypothetical protein